MERNEEIKRNVVKPIICTCSVAHSFGLCKVQANSDFSLEEGSVFSNINSNIVTFYIDINYILKDNVH